MKILSIDTSSIVCSVSILENENILYETSTNSSLSHSEKLMPMVKEAFDKLSLDLSDIDMYVSSIGPGSFTGIRIGISTIKAFIDVFNKPYFGISSLEGLSYNTNSQNLVCSIIDAKNNNIYAGIYKYENGIYILDTNYISDTIQNLLIKLSKYESQKITFVGDGSIIYHDLLSRTFSNCEFSANNNCSSVSNAICAFRKYKNNILDSSNLTPLYLKKPQAERMLEKREGKNG